MRTICPTRTREPETVVAGLDGALPDQMSPLSGMSGPFLSTTRFSPPRHCTGMVAAACGVRMTRLKKVAGFVVITVWT